ncbi:MAG TPA: hypothetical protein VK475_06980, partial [Pyrinomonadaceae bacterium]|nr:hypothetical protein [Pyrinomonadaceae bacterium]
MQRTNQIHSSFKSVMRRRQCQAAMLGLLAIARAVEAQSVLTPPPAFSVSPPALQQFQAEEQGVIKSPEQVSALALQTLFGPWGPVTLRPHVFYRFSYADGIESSPGDHQVTIIHELSPGMLFVIGQHWTLDYSPTLRFFSNNQFHNSLDHSLNLSGWMSYEDWVFSLSQGYSRSSAPLVETGAQTDQESYFTGINASYRFNSKLSVDLAISQSFVLAQQFDSSRSWSTTEYLNYQLWPRLNVAIGMVFSYTDVDFGPDMTSEQLQGRISWRATDKTSFECHAGAEDRQFLSGGAPDLINPVFGLSIQY